MADTGKHRKVALTDMSASDDVRQSHALLELVRAIARQQAMADHEAEQRAK